MRYNNNQFLSPIMFGFSVYSEFVMVMVMAAQGIDLATSACVTARSQVSPLRTEENPPCGSDVAQSAKERWQIAHASEGLRTPGIALGLYITQLWVLGGGDVAYVERPAHRRAHRPCSSDRRGWQPRLGAGVGLDEPRHP